MTGWAELPRIVKEISIDASPETVWGLMATHLKYPEVEAERGPEWEGLVIKDVRGEPLTTEREGIGVRTRWYYRFYFYTFVWDDEVTEWEEGRRIAWRSISTWDMVDSFTVEPREEGARLVYEMDYTPPYGPLGRIWYALFVHRHLEENIEYTLLQMKRNSERIEALERRKEPGGQP